MSTGTPQHYELRLSGQLDQHWAAWFGDLTLSHTDGSTLLSGPVADQAQLHGLLNVVRDVGATLVSVTAVEPDSVEPTLGRELKTERLVLRPGAADDAAATYAYRRHQHVAQWLTELPTDDATYRETFAERGRLANTVVVELNGQLIGDFMLRVEDAWAQAEISDQARNKQAELGWVLDPAYTGNGYATEAVQALVTYCFEDLGVRRVVANCFLGNDSSRRLMGRLGMRQEAHFVAESLHRSGQWLDTLVYAVLAEEWHR